MKRDLTRTATWDEVSEFCRRLYEPGFGRPSDLAEVEVRPGGAEVVCTAVIRDTAEGAGRRAVVAIRDGQLVPVTAPGAESFAPRWSPDGDYLAFLSDRRTRGVYQPQLLTRTAAAEAAEIGVLGTVEQLAWSPAGGELLLRVAEVNEDQPGLPGQPGPGLGEGADSSAPAWLPRVEGGRESASRRRLWVADAHHRTARQVTGDDVTVWEAAWAGPGRVAAITSAGKTDSDWYGAHLVLVDVATGDRETVLTSDLQLGLPTGSPDGEHIAVVQALSSDRGMTVGDLLLLTPGGKPRRLDTCGADVSHVAWIDSTRLSFAGLRGLDNVVGVVDVTTGGAEELWCCAGALGGMVQPSAAVLPDGRVIASRQGYRMPPAIVLHEHGADTELASTAHKGTEDILKLIGSCERVSWTAGDGWQIDGLLARPDAPGPHPLIVSVHGGPLWAWRERWLFTYIWVPLLVSRGYAVLYPNPRGSVGKGRRFAEAVAGDMGGADARDILAGIDSLAAADRIDPGRVGIMGESYGGFMTNWLITQDQRFRAAVPMHTVTHWRSQHHTSVIGAFDEIFLDGQPLALGGAYDERSPLMHVSRVTTPTLHVAGAHDPYTHPAESLQFHHALAERGVESVFVVYPSEGHGVRSYQPTIDLCTRIVGWFETHMPAHRGS